MLATRFVNKNCRKLLTFMSKTLPYKHEKILFENVDKEIIMTLKVLILFSMTT